MITFNMDLSETELREATKNILGIRYRTNKKGEFCAYSNALTMLVDIFKIIGNKIKNK